MTYWDNKRVVKSSGRLSAASTDIEAAGTSGYVVALAYSGSAAGDEATIWSEVGGAGGSGIEIASTPQLSNDAPGSIVFPTDARPRFTNGLSVDTTGTNSTNIVVYYYLD